VLNQSKLNHLRSR